MNKKNILIIGSGESGLGAAKLAHHLNYGIYVTSTAIINKEIRKQLITLGAILEEGVNTDRYLQFVDLIVKSPGVPAAIPLLNKARKQSVKIISEIEFASNHTNSDIIAITGTNGKTTTSSLLFHILKTAGFNVDLVGNIGTSFASSVAEQKFDYHIVETSSFQLEDIRLFKPKVAILLNITEDHLDRYDYSFQNYINTKLKIQMNQSGHDCFIYFSSDKNITNHLSDNNQITYPFGSKKVNHLKYGGWIDKDKIIIKTIKNNLNMTIHNLALQGTHNIYNSMAASITASSMGIKNSIIKNSLSTFKGVEHRLEFVARVSGVKFINDSKATNCNSVYYALDTINAPIIWICGGVDKGNDYKILEQLVKDKVRSIIYVGEKSKKIENEFKSSVEDFIVVQSMQEAVRNSYSIAETGDTVLLSPACSSFDLFKNYEERGNVFKSSVLTL